MTIVTNDEEIKKIKKQIEDWRIKPDESNNSPFSKFSITQS